MTPPLSRILPIAGICCALLLPSRARSQTRYRDVVFPSTTSTVDVAFGTGRTLGGSIDSLRLDLYAPAGDTLTKRPLVVLLHGGSLVVGEKADMGQFGMDLARRGFVAATINYRLGIVPQYTVTGVAEALLRGVQDAKAAVRFLRANAAAYSIDTTQVFLVGSSAGSMIAVHYAFWGQDEIPPEVDQATWGDIEGSGGHPGFSSAVNGIVNYAGAILDPAWIDEGEPAVANFHGLLDEVVPPDSGISNDFRIRLFGGVAISRAAGIHGIYNHNAFFPDLGHGGNVDSLREFTAEFLYSMIVLSTSAPGVFSSIDLPTSVQRVFMYDTHRFVTTAVDPNGRRISVPPSMVQYACDAAVGTIAATGIFTPADHPDSGYVYVSLNGQTDSCYVTTFDFAYFTIRPRVAVTDLQKTLALRIATFDADSVLLDLPVTRFTLESTDTSVGTIDAGGTFLPRQNGTTRIVASFAGRSDTSTVRVESATGLGIVDELESVSGWAIEAVNVDSVGLSVSADQASAGSGSFRIDYAVTYNAAAPISWVYLTKDVVVYGIPDTMYLDVRSDGRRHRLYYRFSDAESQEFRASGLKFLNDSTAFSRVHASLLGLTALTGTPTVSYPLTIKRIEIQLAPQTTQGVTTTGTLFVDNLTVRYPGSVVSVEDGPIVPEAFRLEQNFPNPFNPTTTIRYAVPEQSQVSLEVYNLLGQRVAELVHGMVDAGVHEVRLGIGDLPTGVYVYRLRAGEYHAARKLLLLR